MLPDLEILQKYASGKKYQHALQTATFDFGKYKANYIFPGRDGKTLYCQVTRLTLNKIPSEIDNHIRGKRYQQELKRYEAKLDRTKAANAKRDAKVREAADNGWVMKDKSNPIEAHGSDDERVDMSALGEISKPQKSKKAWYDDLSDLNPGLNRSSGTSDFEETEYADGHPIMEFLSRIAASEDEDSDHEDSEEPAPSKPTKKANATEKSSKSTKSEEKPAKEPRKIRKGGERQKSALAESIEEDLKPKRKSIKEAAKETRDKRDKKEKRDKRSK